MTAPDEYWMASDLDRAIAVALVEAFLGFYAVL